MAAKSKSNNGNGTTGNGPALHFEHIERRESKPYLMDTRVLEMIELYPLYIESVTGHKPDAGQVIEKCVEQILSGDAGFKKFIANQTAKTAPASAKANGNTQRTDPPNSHRNSKNPNAEASSQQAM